MTIVILFSSCMFRVQNESPIRVLTAYMFSSPSTMFELPWYVVGVANLLADAPSPPLICNRPFNKLVEDFLDIEAEDGKDSDRHGSPSCWILLVCLGHPSHMYWIFFLNYKFVCWIFMCLFNPLFNLLFIIGWFFISNIYIGFVGRVEYTLEVV